MKPVCAQREEILAPKALRTVAPELLEAHLAQCEPCRSCVEDLISIRSDLARHAPAPGPGAKARILGELAANGFGLDPARASRTRHRPRLALMLGLGLAATAAAWLGFWIPGLPPEPPNSIPPARLFEGELVRSEAPAALHLFHDDPVPLAQALRVESAARIDTGLARLGLSAGARLTLGTHKAVVDEVELLAGQLHAEVTPLPPGHSFVVRTPEAIVTVIGTAFRVIREHGQTRVEVDHGVVRAASPDGERVIELRSGDAAIFPRLLPGDDPAAAPGVEPPSSDKANEAAERSANAVAKIADRARGRTRNPARGLPGQATRRQPDPPTPHAPTLSEAAILEPPSPSPHAAPQTPVLDERPPAQDRRLAQARRALRSTPAEAVVLARALLDAAPPEAIEAEALAVLADGYRRGGHLDDAARTYARVAEHPAGEALAEESLLQLALLRKRQARAPEARAALERAARRFPGGVLAPERVALAVDLSLQSGDLDRAASLLLRHPDLHGPELEAFRVRQAERLAPFRPEDARALLAATRLQSLSPALEARHQALARTLDISRRE